MDCCVYKITNINNKKMYIGSTINFDSRKKRHIRQLENNIHHSILLQRSWNKHGKDSFMFEIIEYCEKDILFEREQYYLDLFQPFNENGYNISKTAQCCSLSGEMNGMYGKFGENNPNYGRKNTLESNKKISDSLKGIKRTQEFKNKMSEIAKLRTGEKNPRYNKHMSDMAKQNLSQKRSEKVIQYDKFTGKYLNIWDSAKIAYENLGIDNSSIAACCRNKLKTAGGYIWRKYNNEYIENINLFDIEPHFKIDERHKRVYQYDSNLNLLNIWDNIKFASINTGIKDKNIRSCCVANTHSHFHNFHKSSDFIWSYNKI